MTWNVLKWSNGLLQKSCIDFHVHVYLKNVSSGTSSKKKNPLLKGLQLSSNAELKKLEIRELILIDTQTYIDMLEYNPKYLPHEFYPNDISQWKSIIDCNQQNQ